MATDGFSQAAYDKFIEDEKSATLKARGGTYGGDSETLIVEGMDGYNATSTGDKTATLGVNCGMSTGRNGVMTVECKTKGFPLGFRAENTRLYDETATTLCNGTRPGWCNGVIGADSKNAIVRRLTPLECERLQGFPDNWTNIGDWIDENGKKHKDSDSPRYKALGNSIAIPPWFYVLQKLSLCCGADTTMGSLFDGIGGFPYIWEQLNGQGSCVWASEIEGFPIAVTKIHFTDKGE